MTGTVPELANQLPASDGTPAPFDFTDVTDAESGEFYEDSAALSGFNQPITASVSAGSGEIRKNGTDSWSTSLSVYPGDTLNIRTTSSGSYATAVTTTIQVGASNVDWSIATEAECGGYLSEGYC